MNSATEQIEDQKRSMIDIKSGRMEKDLSENKKNIYKDLSKTVERYRHLPKLKVQNKDRNSLLSSYEPNATIEPNFNRSSQYNVDIYLSIAE